MDHPGRVLVLADGGLAGLVAIAAAREAVSAFHAPNLGDAPDGEVAVRPLVMFLPRDAAQTDLRSAAVRRQAARYDAEVVAAPMGVGGLIGGGETGLADSITLALAAGLATAARVPEVVWPAFFGRPGEPESVDLDALARACDRAVLATRAAALDAHEHRVPSIRVKTPYADLSAKQLGELALDLNVPIESCWWWAAANLAGGMESAATSVAIRERHEWAALLAGMGWRSAGDELPGDETAATPEVIATRDPAVSAVAGMSMTLPTRRRQRNEPTP